MLQTEILLSSGGPAPPPALPVPMITIDLLGLVVAGRSRGTAQGYGYDLRDFAAFHGFEAAADGLEWLRTLTGGLAYSAALAYREALTTRGLAAATIGRRLATLRSACKRMRKAGLIDFVLEIESPKTQPLRDTAGPGLKAWLGMVDAARAQKNPRRALRDTALLMLLYTRGLRRGEVAGLDLADVDLNPEAPTVNVLGKARTEKEKLTIAEPCRVAIEEWIAVRGEHDGPLFHPLSNSADPRARLRGPGICKIVKRLGVAAGVPVPVRPHGLRHTAITRLLDMGADLRDAAQFSRHKSIQTLFIYDDRRKDVAGDLTRRLAAEIA
jgi:integrase